MSAQNLISATISSEVKTEILQKIGEVKGRLPFLVTLQPADIQGLFKAGDGYAPFVEKAYHVVCDHPSIMSGIFNTDEFKRDFQLAKDLDPIENQLIELTEAVQNTLIAVNSDAMGGALEVYAAVQQNKNKIPGLNTLADDMSEFFKKSKRKKPEPSK
jgi:hypothetical protein